MSRSIFIFFFLILLTSCSVGKLTKANTAAVTHTISLGGWIQCDTSQYIFVTSSLQNNTDDTVRYITWSCTYFAGYQTSDTAIYREGWLCFTNVPFISVLAPRASHSSHVRLLTKIPREDWGKRKFRLGFDLITVSNESERWKKAEEYGKMNNVIWSNDVTLSDAF